MVLLAHDWTQARIANALGISEPVLRQYYSSELKLRSMARDALEAEMLMSMAAQAAAGSVGAVKQVQARFDRTDMAARARAAAGDAGDVAKPQPRPVAKGKKDQARQTAEDVLAANPLFDPLRVN
jgi:hypothetical protein